MKTIYSFNEFYDAIMEIAKSIDENYVSVRVERTTEYEFKFSCYINNLNWYHGRTMQEAIENIRAATGKPITHEIDVDIELPQTA